MAGVVALSGVAVAVGPVRADQYQCVEDLPFNSRVCVETTNSGGADGDEHRVTVFGNESVPGLGIGFNPSLSCDDDGGTSDAVIEINAGPEAPVAVPTQCPELP